MSYEAEVTNISKHGLRLMVHDEEFFLAFEDFPWFKEAKIASVLAVEMPRPGQLHWPEIDVDLTLEAIRHPAKYPLVSKPS